MKDVILLMLAAASLMAADATGKWTGTMTVITADGGDRPRPALLMLKQEGNKLNGTAGPDAGEQTAIEHGKVEDGNLTFELPTGDTVMKFALKQDGDQIKGDVTRNHEGELQRAKISVTRDK